MENYYKTFCMSRTSFSKKRLEKHYKVFKELIKSNLNQDKYKKDKQIVLELYEFSLKLDNAYKVLSNDEKRKEYNEYLDRQKQEKKKDQKKKNDEEYNCFEMYNPTLIKSVDYKKNEMGEMFFFSPTYNENNSKKRMDCKLIGFISYSTVNGQLENGLCRYEIGIISTANPERKKYTVITKINFDELMDNPEYKKAISEKLLSEKNLEQSKKENYGYIGGIIKKNNEYILEYNQQEFCAAIYFGNNLKRNVDKPNVKNKKGGRFIKKNNRRIFGEER